MVNDALIYTRASRDKTGAGLSIARQEEDCRELAQRLGLAVREVFADNDISAYSGKPRPGYRAMLETIEADPPAAVIAWHTDRLHRRPAELETYIGACDPGGVVTHTVKAGPLDLSTPSGRLVARQLGAVARFEVEHMIERMRRQKMQVAEAGGWRGGRRAFGYERDGMTIVPAEAALLLNAAEDIINGSSMHSILREWQEAGVQTATGCDWTRTTEIRRTLMRPRNAGRIEHPKGVDFGEANWDPIIPRDMWQAMCSILADQDRRTTPGPANRWLGSGIYQCGECGKTLTVSSTGGKGRPKRSVYRCRERGLHVARDADRLDSFVGEHVIARLSRPDGLALLRFHEEDDTPALRLELAMLNQRLEAQTRLHSMGDITERQYSMGSRILNEEVRRVEGRLATAVRRNVLSGLDVDPRGTWEGLGLMRKREIVKAIMDVTVLRAPLGRPVGHKPGDDYFRPEYVRIEWVTGDGSERPIGDR